MHERTLDPRRGTWADRIDLAICPLLAAVAAGLFFMAIGRNDFNDLSNHVAIAMRPTFGDAFALGYPLFHALVRALVALTGAEPMLAGAIVSVVAKVALVLSLYAILRRPLDALIPRSRAMAAAVAVLLSLIGPFGLLTLPNAYLGYIAFNLVHNPTILVLMPVALWEVIVLVGLVADPTPPRRRVALAAVLMVLSSLAKPSFNIAVAPAFGIALLAQVLARRRTTANAIRVAAAPLAALLVVSGVQAHLLFLGATAAHTGRVSFSPFEVMRIFSDGSIALALLKIALSVLVPLAGLRVLPSASEAPKARAWVMLAWLTLGVALVEAALFAESGGGRSVSHGNFFWGAYAANLVLHVATIAGCGIITVRPAAWWRARDGAYRPMIVALGLSLLGGLMIIQPLHGPAQPLPMRKPDAMRKLESRAIRAPRLALP